MKINAINSTVSNFRQPENQKRSDKTAFKGGGFLGVVGNLMQGIENQGYFASFLIQDTIGMTGPRTITGFTRDRDVTGKINTQEGFEVLFREGLTGPYMMAVAPLVLFATTKFCRSTNTNTNLIKRYGQELKKFVSNSNTATAVKETAAEFKSKFAKFNIEQIYRKTVPNDSEATATIERILDEFESVSSKDKKVRNKALTNISEIINEKILETSENYYSLNKVIVGEGHSGKQFNTKEAIRALSDFIEDAIVKNPQAKEIDATAAENIKNNFATKRILTNIANVALTLGGLSVIPKIYAKSDVPPSAMTIQYMKDQKAKENQLEEVNQNEVAFKGKGINSGGIFSKIGKIITEHMPEKMSELLEYTGINFTKTMFAGLSIFGLLFPRGIRAVNRAQVDEKTGKKDLSELKEVLVRDTISSLTVVFAVPILTKIFVNMYENSLGFILTKKPTEQRNSFQKLLDVLNPYSNLEVLSMADLDSIYGNIDSKAKLLNFANFVDKNGGDLEKILSKSENVKEMFNEGTFKLESIKNLTKQEKNRKIIDLFKNIEVADPKAKHDLISKLMKGTEGPKANKIAQTVRGLNSLPGMFATFVISPILLGVLIPKLTYKNTRKNAEAQMNK